MRVKHVPNILQGMEGRDKIEVLPKTLFFYKSSEPSFIIYHFSAGCNLFARYESL